MPKASKAKKLVSVLAISASVTGANKEAQVIQVTQGREEVILDQVPCIHYLFQFQKGKEASIWALIDSGSEVNAMNSAYAKKLGFRIWKTDIGAQKLMHWV